jgi:TPR repeat/Tetratricopeptide repeat
VVLSAVVKDQKIAGATVILQKNGAQSVPSLTGPSGDAGLIPAFSEKDEGVLLLVKKAGYSTLVAKCPCDGMTYAISPVMTALDGLRVVLNWGATPPDLDSHLVYPGNHIFWDAKVGRQANLDVDSYGPETITVERKHFGEKYVYAVHSYTDTTNPNSDALSLSRAKVFVYIGQTLIRSYYVPANRRGNLWVVFEVDGQGEFHDINVVRAAPPGPQLDVAVLNAYLSGGNVAQQASVSAGPAGEAQRLNKLGETSYHAGQLDDAIDYYRQALDLDPAFGQAYSNLGLAYQKADRIAEAIWANRKAIALASGANANVVRASSYYNIARIYERAGQFQDALAQYELAQKEKPGSVYENAIARMKIKLGL